MAIVTSATFAGLDINRVRIDSTIRASDALAIARMQSHVWQRITATAGGGSLVATPHIHDGSNGAIIPIPLVSNTLGARIARADTDTGAGWAPVSYVPIYAAPGMTRVRVIGLGRNARDREGFRVRTYFHDANGFPSPYQERFGARFLPGVIPEFVGSDFDRVSPWYVDIDTPLATESGATPWFSLEISAWDGMHWANAQEAGSVSPGPEANRFLDTFFALPVVTDGVNRTPATPFTQSGVHSVTVHDGIEETMLSTDRALSSFVVDRMARNDISLESGLLAHKHGNEFGRFGTVFRQPLFSHGMGVMRARPGFGPEQIRTDELIGAGGDPLLWSGRLFAPCRTATSTAAAPVARARFQMPPGEAADLGVGGAASRMQCAVLVNYVVNSTVSAEIFGATSFAGGGGAVSQSLLTSAGSGRRLVILDGIKCSDSGSGAGEDQTLVVSLKRDAAASASKSIGIYGYSLAVTE